MGTHWVSKRIAPCLPVIAALWWLSAGAAAQCPHILPEEWLSGDAGQDPDPERVLPGCLALLTDAALYEELANPHLATMEDIRQRLDEGRRLTGMLRLLDAALAGEQTDADTLRLRMLDQLALRLLTTFTYFTAEIDGNELDISPGRYTLLMSHWLDRRERAFIRNTVEKVYTASMTMFADMGITPPSGVLYIRVERDWNDMKHLYGLGETVGGVTFPCRYVGLPWDGDRRGFRITLAHELVHAVCNSHLGFEHLGSLEKWWEEGLAVFLSRDPGLHMRKVETTMTPHGLTVTKSYSETVDEYMFYKSIFTYIMTMHGTERFNQFVAASLAGHSTDAALRQTLRLAGETALAEAVTAWKKKYGFWKDLLLLVVILTFVGLLIGFIKAGHAGGALVLLAGGAGVFFIGSTGYFRYTHSYRTYALWVLIAAVVWLGYAFFTAGSRHEEESPGPVAREPERFYPTPDWLLHPPEQEDEEGEAQDDGDADEEWEDDDQEPGAPDMIPGRNDMG
ncbi:hypothetical protein JW905_04010 [bacterium]|nr:hypothetical protein [candidate division CSSED10-310 bacterium]